MWSTTYQRKLDVRGQSNAWNIFYATSSKGSGGTLLVFVYRQIGLTTTLGHFFSMIG